MIIVIVGPTGVGKSSLALRVAKDYNGVIINGDAFQSYKGMDIGTAKPTKEERSLVPHYLFDYVDPSTSFTIFEYQKNLREKLDELKGKNIIIVGGSGLYLKSALYDFTLSKDESHVDLSEYEKLDNEALHNKLKELDEEASKAIHMNNRRRVLRAIEICLSQGKKKTDIEACQEHKPLYDVKFIGLTKEREELYSLINKRVDLMVEQGLIDEVKSLMNKYPHDLRSFQAIGYKEIIEALDNNLPIEGAIDKVKQLSRNYAKRQFTYFKHQLPVEWFEDKDKAYEYIASFFAKK
jgi:tRNA dimethylallyltransferase